MNRTEKKALETLINMLIRTTSGTAADLDNPAYHRGYQHAAVMASDTIRFILKPPNRKELRLYADQPRYKHPSKPATP